MMMMMIMMVMMMIIIIIITSYDNLISSCHRKDYVYTQNLRLPEAF